DEAEANTSKSLRQGARKAAREGLAGEKRTDAVGLDIFYRLHLETRRRLGVPTQPKSFIDRFAGLFDAGRGGVWLVRGGEEEIGAAVYLTPGNLVASEHGPPG